MFECETNKIRPETSSATNKDESASMEKFRTSRPPRRLTTKDKAIISKIEDLGRRMESLKLKLAFEKEKLARARMESGSMPTYQSTSSIADVLFPPQELHISRNLSGWGGVPFLPDYKLMFNQMYANEFYFPENLSPRRQDFLKKFTPDVYKDYLHNVERMCQDELDRMQEGITHLQRSLQNFETPNLQDHNYSSMSDASSCGKTPRKHHRHHHNHHHHKQWSKPEERTRRSHHKNGHRRHHQSHQKSYYDLEEKPLTLDRHYRHHYKDCLREKRVVNESFDGLQSGEMSTASDFAKMWQPQLLFESGYD